MNRTFIIVFSFLDLPRNAVFYPVFKALPGSCIFLKISVTGQIIAYFCKLLRPNSSKNRSKMKIPTTMDFYHKSFLFR